MVKAVIAEVRDFYPPAPPPQNDHKTNHHPKQIHRPAPPHTTPQGVMALGNFQQAAGNATEVSNAS